MTGATFRKPATYGLQAGSLGTNIPAIISGLISRILPLVGALFLLMFVYGGFTYLTAGGDSKKVGQAQTTLINATIGVAIVMMAYFIVSYFIGVSGSIVSG